MNGRTKLRIDPLSVRAGNRQPGSASIHVPDAPSRRARRARGNLFVLIETTHGLAAPKSLCADLVTAVVDSYYELSGSVTRALRTALLAANDLLYERNLRASSEHQLLVGLNCVVIRGEDVYIGQLGPALVSLVHEGVLIRYPADSIWLRTPNPGDYTITREPPAGLRRASEPNLYHAQLSLGDVLILSTTDLARIASDRDLLNSVVLAEDRSVRDNLERLARGTDLDALIIEYPGGLYSRLQPVETETSADIQSSEVASNLPDLEAAEAHPTGGPEPEAQREPVTAASSADSQPVAEVEPWSDGAQGEGEEYEGEAEGPAQPWIDFDGLRESVTSGAARVRQGAEEWLVRVLPDAPPGPLPKPRRDVTGLSLSGRAFVIVVMAIPLVVFLLVAYARFDYYREQRQQLTSIIAEAQAKYDAAMREEDEGEKRELLLATVARCEDGLSIAPDNEDLQDIERRAEHELDRLDRVTRLYHFWQLASLEDDAASPTDSSRIVIHGIDVFILNRGSDRVYKFLLNDAGDAFQPLDSDPILVQKGEVRGGVQLGDMVDIAWVEAGGHRTLSTFMALERAGTLLAYDSQQGIDALPVADSDLWLNPQAIGGYFGNLYVLDPLLSRILKYVPTDNAYTNPPSDYLSPQLDVDLTGAVDMTVDGNLYVLFADGRILKFFDGTPEPFPMNGLPTPMRSPTTIFVSGPQDPEAEGYIYVTDTGNQRILQFDKAGNYIRQFKAKSGESQMERLRGIYVDEESQRVFLLSGRILWLADLPPIGED